MTLYVVLYVQLNTAWHPLAICSCEETAKWYIANVETDMDRNLMAYMELPFFQ